MAKALVDGELIDIEAGPADPAHLAAVAAARASRPRHVSGLVFIDRIQPEYAAIMQAAQVALANGDPRLAIWIDKLRVNGSINVNGADAQAAKALCIAEGLFTPERAAVVFAP